MNLREASSSLRRLAFQISRIMSSFLPGGRISAFGAGDDRIGSISASSHAPARQPVGSPLR